MSVCVCGGGGGGGEGVTFDRALEIVRIILELRSQIRSLVLMRLLCGYLQHQKSADYSGPVAILRPNNADNWICERGIMKHLFAIFVVSDRYQIRKLSDNYCFIKKKSRKFCVLTMCSSVPLDVAFHHLCCKGVLKNLLSWPRKKVGWCHDPQFSPFP